VGVREADRGHDGICRVQAVRRQETGHELNPAKRRELQTIITGNREYRTGWCIN
jgi:hypothetical protein